MLMRKVTSDEQDGQETKSVEDEASREFDCANITVERVQTLSVHGLNVPLPHNI